MRVGSGQLSSLAEVLAPSVTFGRRSKLASNGRNSPSGFRATATAADGRKRGSQGIPDRAGGGRGHLNTQSKARKVTSVPINNNKAAEEAAAADRAKFNYSDNLNDSTDVRDKE